MVINYECLCQNNFGASAMSAWIACLHGHAHRGGRSKLAYFEPFGPYGNFFSCFIEFHSYLLQKVELTNLKC